MFTSQMLPQMPSSFIPSLLNDDDQEVLRVRGIAPEVAAERGCRTITTSEARRYGFGGDHARSGLLIPSFGTQGEIVRHQLRPHEPVQDANGKSQRYLWPPGSRQSLDVPPALRPLLGRVDTPVILTESILKGDALLSAIRAEGTVPHAVLAVAGVWGWRSQGAPISDFGDLPWCRRGRDRRITFRRTIFILFDSDCATNPHVASARWELTEFLRRKGAAVDWLDLPQGPEGGKQGVDDYLAAGGSLAALLASAYAAPDRPPPSLASNTSSAPEPLVDEHLTAQLRQENEQLQRLVSAQAQLLRSSSLKERQKRFAFAAISAAHARRARGEVTPDGHVALSTSEVANDFRPEPPKGERAMPTNPKDGSFPLGSRDKVRGDLRPLRDAGALDFIERPVTRQHADGTRYYDTELLIRADDVADCAIALTRLHAYGRPPRKMSTPQRPYLLRGLVFCSVCGRPMYAGRDYSSYAYRCSSRDRAGGACGGKRVPGAAVEMWAWNQIESVLREPSTIIAEVERRRQNGPDAALQNSRETAARMLQKIEKQRERLVRRYAEAEDDGFPWELVEREIARVETERRTAQVALAEIDARLAQQEHAIVELDAVRTYCDRVGANLDAADFATKRSAIEALVQRIDANGREWTLSGSLPCDDDAGVVSRSS